MAFPDAEVSVVTEDKLCDYLLNPSHPVGGPRPLALLQLDTLARTGVNFAMTFFQWRCRAKTLLPNLHRMV